MISIIPEHIIKTWRTNKWEELFNRGWSQVSESDDGRQTVILTMFDLVFKEYYYGRTLFWVENYYKNTEDYLLKNMWLAVDHKSMYVIHTNISL